MALAVNKCAKAWAKIIFFWGRQLRFSLFWWLQVTVSSCIYIFHLFYFTEPKVGWVLSSGWNLEFANSLYVCDTLLSRRNNVLAKRLFEKTNTVGLVGWVISFEYIVIHWLYSVTHFRPNYWKIKSPLRSCLHYSSNCTFHVSQNNMARFSFWLCESLNLFIVFFLLSYR